MKAPEIERVEELCEEIWSLAEAGQNTAQRLLGGSKLTDPQEALAMLRRQGLASVEGDRVVLTEPGAQIARAVIRRHRLAEVLFSQVLSLEESISESTACEMEHILSSQVTDSICAYLGHPPRCPHGKPIPQGRCCRSLSPTIKPLVSRLSDLGIGEAGRIVFIAPSTRGSLERVASLGVVPGNEIRLVQRKPAVVFESGCTTIAVDREIAEEIFVRRNPTEA